MSRHIESWDSHLPAFKYGSLGSESITSRLVQLLKAPKHDADGRTPRIRCKLKPLYVGGGEVYDAISYVWGSAARDRSIEVSGAVFKISAVVDDMLLRLRDENADRLLWIDLICIDQENDEEKSLQVARMREIYENARTVIISLGPHHLKHWLGTRDLRTETIAHHIQRQHDMRAAMDVLSIMSLDINRLHNDHVKIIAPLLSHEWFECVWVVQEVAFARKLLVVCADKQVDGEVFGKLASGVTCNVTRAPDLRSKLVGLRPLLNFMTGDSSSVRTRPELLSLLQQFREWKASLPHDKIYAMLALSQDGPNAQVLRPRYALPVEVVYRNVVKHAISRYKSLAILTYAIQPCQYTSQPRADSATAGRQTWSSWLFDQLFRISSGPPSSSNIIPYMPSWCPDWGVSYTLIEPPEPVFEPPSPSEGFGRSLKSRRAWSELDKGSNHDVEVLKVWAYTVATVASIMDSNVVVSLSEEIKVRIQRLASVCTRISQRLSDINRRLAESNARSFSPGDHITFLNGASGIAVLRPRVNNYELLFLDHSDFGTIRRNRDGVELDGDTGPSGSVFSDLLQEFDDVRNDATKSMTQRLDLYWCMKEFTLV